MSLTKYTISDESSFAEVTAGPRQIAALYFYLRTDWLVECARTVAFDFQARPHLYASREAAGEPFPAGELGALRVRSGNDERVPSREQRAHIFGPIFGYPSGAQSSNSSDFCDLRDELLEAAAAFAEGTSDGRMAMLRERVRSLHRPFRQYLTELNGASLSWSINEAISSVTRALAYPVLRTRSISEAFGISTPPDSRWPFAADAHGDSLVEQISARATGASSSPSTVTRAVFGKWQRAALSGAEALAVIVDYTGDGSPADLDVLITKCYLWGSSLTAQHG